VDGEFERGPGRPRERARQGKGSGRRGEAGLATSAAASRW